MASYLYYHTAYESPLTDAEYDQRVDYVVANWSETTSGFRKRTTKDELAATGTHITPTEAEKAAALKWIGKS